ncbi:unnamed protein product, partial [Prorocentrum cordatum]
ALADRGRGARAAAGPRRRGPGAVSKATFQAMHGTGGPMGTPMTPADLRSGGYMDTSYQDSADEFLPRAPQSSWDRGRRRRTDSPLSREMSTLLRYEKCAGRQGLQIYGQGWAKLSDVSSILQRSRE